MIDLASKEYSRVVDKKRLQGQIITVTFKQRHKGLFRIIPIHAKRARGLMVDYIIRKQIDNAARNQGICCGRLLFQQEGFDADGVALFKKQIKPIRP